MGKKKAFGFGEVWTSIKRHYNNVYNDPGRQRIINLFLGIFIPMAHKIPIWQQSDEDVQKEHQKRAVKLPQI